MVTLKQHSSANNHLLLSISKGGDVYLRTLMIHGPRALVTQANHGDNRLRRWLTGIATRRHPNVAAVALANKTARRAWAMLRHETAEPFLASSCLKFHKSPSDDSVLALFGFSVCTLEQKADDSEWPRWQDPKNPKVNVLDGEDPTKDLTRMAANPFCIAERSR